MQYAVIRYTKQVQELLGSATEAQPWLHCCIVTSKIPFGKGFVRTLDYAIYVWDTRQVIESKIRKEQIGQVDELTFRMLHFKKAADSNEKLQGKVSQQIQDILSKRKRHILK